MPRRGGTPVRRNGYDSYHGRSRVRTFLKVLIVLLLVVLAVGIFLFMMMTAVGSYQIITRYFFNRPSTVSEELLTYPLPGCPFFASAYVFGKRDHMRMGFMQIN